MKIALGTVQFGLDYGVANEGGIVSRAEVSDILACARGYGVDTLDTAITYGESEAVLGDLPLDHWKIVSKIPPGLQGGVSPYDWAVAAVGGSLARLKRSSIYGVLLHRSKMLLEPGGVEVFEALQRLKKNGVISKIGISIYSPEELEILIPKFELDLVQAPFSVFDRRLLNSGWLQRLGERGIEVHTRSAFLQGLLLVPSGRLPGKFRQWQPVWREWESWLASSNLTALEACVRYSLSQSNIGKVVVGVQTAGQLFEILEAARKGAMDAPAFKITGAETLQNPANWNSLME